MVAPYAELFCQVLMTGASEFLKHCPPRKPRGGEDPLFRENDMRDYVKQALLDGRMRFPQEWPELEIESRGRIDYCFVEASSVLATCEVKGPVRAAFFDPKRFGQNWTGPRLLKDVRNQLRRAKAGDGAHYLGLLFPFAEARIRTNDLGSDLRGVIRRIEAAVPGAILTESACQSKPLQTGTSLTTVVIQVNS